MGVARLLAIGQADDHVLVVEPLQRERDPDAVRGRRPPLVVQGQARHLTRSYTQRGATERSHHALTHDARSEPAFAALFSLRRRRDSRAPRGDAQSGACSLLRRSDMATMATTQRTRARSTAADMTSATPEARPARRQARPEADRQPARLEDGTAPQEPASPSRTLDAAEDLVRQRGVHGLNGGELRVEHLGARALSVPLREPFVIASGRVDATRAVEVRGARAVARPHRNRPRRGSLPPPCDPRGSG